MIESILAEISTFAPAAACLWKVVESYGIDPGRLFHEEGVDLNLPVDADLRIPYQKIDRIRARAAELTGDEAFGLHFGRLLHPSYLGALGYAWLASRTLRIALERYQRFIRILNAYAVLEIRDSDGLMELRFSMDLPSLNPLVRDDAAMAVLVEMMRYNYGPGLPVTAVTLRRPRPRDDGPWRRFFGCEVKFEARHNAIRMPLGIAGDILPSANPRFAQLNEEMALRYLERLDHDDFSGCVRAEIVRQLPCGQFDQQRVAEALHMTPRTMRRRLQAEEASFKALVTEVRQHLADQFVHSSRLTLTEISFNLGFSELSSFTRAYRNWNGHSPTEARSRARTLG